MATNPLEMNPTQYALTLLENCGIKNPPTDIDKCCILLGDIKLIPGDIKQDGYLLVRNDDKAEIFFRDDIKIGRKRFTQAHELGHWILFKLGKKYGKYVQEIYDKNQDKVELWCNRFATNFLMPESWVKHHIGSNNNILQIDTHKNGIEKFQVSREHYFNRLFDFYKCIIFYIHYDKKYKIRYYNIFPRNIIKISDQEINKMFNEKWLQDFKRRKRQWMITQKRYKFGDKKPRELLIIMEKNNQQKKKME